MWLEDEIRNLAIETLRSEIEIKHPNAYKILTSFVGVGKGAINVTFRVKNRADDSYVSEIEEKMSVSIPRVLRLYLDSDKEQTAS